MNYQEFIESKRKTALNHGFDAENINEMLFPFQKAIVRWAIKKGRAAIFADCGMGKTPIQLEWANQIYKNTGLNVLILAPLAVAAQTVREGKKFHIEVKHARQQSEVIGGITVTNYEMLHKFDIAYFGAVILDESSILKSYMGKTKMALLELFKDYQYKLACTATPAPNDHMELGNHAEFLGVMPSNEMLARWFINDTMTAGKYRVKGHGKRDFWRWVSSWAVSLQKPSDIGDYSDDGYILPELKIKTAVVEAPPPDGMLFHTGGTLSATEIHKVKRQSAEDRAKLAAEFVNANELQCICWCDTDYEADALKKAIPDAVDVRGSMTDKQKEESLLGFVNGDFKTLISKPQLAGYGMNFQQAHRAVFVGLSYSFENLYQALRRIYRFGQKYPVECLIVESQAESGIRDVVFEKVRKHEEMQKEMCSDMKEFQTIGNKALKNAPEPKLAEGENWQLWNGDCVQVMREKIADESLDFSIFSPPFANLYIYSDSIADMGNCSDYNEFFKQFDYLIEELYRATVNGRLCSVHCKDLPAYKGRDGAAGLIDFPGAIIRAFEKRGWQYHSRVTIWKDPVIEMQRTKNHGLLHKQLCKDSAASRQGMADYLLTFRKWNGDEFPNPVHGKSKEVRFTDYVGEEPPEGNLTDRHMSIQVWQRYASPVWFDIQQTKVLQGYKYATSEEDEKHICLAPDTLILTKRGYVPIKDVLIGDETITHAGNWKKIIAKKQTRKDAKVIKTHAMGVPNLITTPDHKIWTRISKKNDARKTMQKSNPEWIEAEKTKSHYVNQKLPAIMESDLTSSEWWIVGRYLADGHVGTRGDFHISVGTHKADIFEEKAKDYIGFYADKGATRQYRLKNLSSNLIEMLNKCGKGALNKQVPIEGVCLNKELAELLLDGYLSGDGHLDELGRWHITSISRALLLGMSMVAMRARNIVCSVYAGKKAKKHIIEGRTVNARQCWVMLLSPRNQSGIILDDGAWKKVRKIEDAGISDVWSIQVEDDASYTAENCIVKNCPLQLQVIERAIHLWTNEGDTVFSPFAGIGSEPYTAVKMKRKAIGIELKESYFGQAIKNVEEAVRESKEGSLFDLVEE